MWKWIKHQWHEFWWTPSMRADYPDSIPGEFSFKGMIEVALIMAGVGFVLYLLIHGW